MNLDHEIVFEKENKWIIIIIINKQIEDMRGRGVAEQCRLEKKKKTRQKEKACALERKLDVENKKYYNNK